jgi:hypothetical protein
VQNDWHPWKNIEPENPSGSRLIKIEFVVLLTLVVVGLAVSLLSAVGVL